MSLKVDLDQLAAALANHAFAYLVTVSDDYRAHTVAVGTRTRTNARSHADVTLVWPPREPGGYTLIVDGVANVADDGLTVEPTGAVLHRSATPTSPTASGCGDDCVPLG